MRVVVGFTLLFVGLSASAATRSRYCSVSFWNSNGPFSFRFTNNLGEDPCRTAINQLNKTGEAIVVKGSFDPATTYTAIRTCKVNGQMDQGQSTGVGGNALQNAFNSRPANATSCYLQLDGNVESLETSNVRPVQDTDAKTAALSAARKAKQAFGAHTSTGGLSLTGTDVQGLDRPRIIADHDVIAVNPVPLDRQALLVNQAKKAVPQDVGNMVTIVGHAAAFGSQQWNQGDSVAALNMGYNTSSSSLLEVRASATAGAKLLSKNWSIFDARVNTTRPDMFHYTVSGSFFVGGNVLRSVNKTLSTGQKVDRDVFFNAPLVQFDQWFFPFDVPVHVKASLNGQVGHDGITAFFNAYNRPTDANRPHVEARASARPFAGLNAKAWGGVDALVIRGGVGGNINLVSGTVDLAFLADRRAADGVGQGESFGGQVCYTVTFDHLRMLDGKLYADYVQEVPGIDAAAQVGQEVCHSLAQVDPTAILNNINHTIRDIGDTITQGTDQIASGVQQIADAVTHFHVPGLGLTGGGIPTLSCSQLVDRLKSAGRIRYYHELYRWNGRNFGNSKVWDHKCTTN